MSRIIVPLEQFFDDAGDPLIDGLLYFYETGTNTALDTFSDVNLVNVNTNPLPLTAAGRCPNAYGYNRLYRVVLKTSAGVQILQRDNVGSFAAESAFSAWIFDKTYLKSEIVTYGYKYYRSNVDGNIGNAPDSTGQWSELDIPEKYSSTVTYGLHKLVYDAGTLYISAQAGNVGNATATAHAWWQRVNNIPHWGSTSTYRHYDLAIDSNGVVVVSQQNANINHNPVGDSGTWWRPQWQTIAAFNEVLQLSGGGLLTARFTHELNDSSTYTLPLANSVPAKTVLICGKSETFKAQNPVLQRSGSDVIRYGGGTDTELRFSAPYMHSLRFVSNGSNEWSI